MQQESRSMPRASLGHFLRRNGRTLPQRISPYTRIKRKERNSPPMNNVSPVNTTRCSPSCMKKQILSCVWQGVCRALTEMRSPILNVSPCFGVEVTDKQFRPPMMGSLPNCSSWVVRSLVWLAGPRNYLLSRCFHRHGPSDWIVSSFAIHRHDHIRMRHTDGCW